MGDIFRDWPGGSDVTIIHGRPRHPQSQGLVERGHQLIQSRLAIAEQEWTEKYPNTVFPWHLRLPIIQFQVNSSHSSVINQTPYGVVFGRQPNPPPFFGRETLVMEDRHEDQTDHSFSTAYSDH